MNRTLMLVPGGFLPCHVADFSLSPSSLILFSFRDFLSLTLQEGSTNSALPWSRCQGCRQDNEMRPLCYLSSSPLPPSSFLLSLLSLPLTPPKPSPPLCPRHLRLWHPAQERWHANCTAPSDSSNDGAVLPGGAAADAFRQTADPRSLCCRPGPQTADQPDMSNGTGAVLRPRP